jgi:hypothetical protein
MGWLFMRSIAPHRTPRDYLDAQFTFSENGVTRRILSSAVVKTRTYYAALEIAKPDVPPDVVGIVCLIKYNPRDREDYVFGYKDMDETVGPCAAECPAAILVLLTDTDSEYAREWRDRCREFAARRRSHGPLRNGDRIVFPVPIDFTDRTSHSAFEVSIDRNRPRAIRLLAPNGRLYRISNLKEREFRLERGTD